LLKRGAARLLDSEAPMRLPDIAQGDGRAPALLDYSAEPDSILSGFTQIAATVDIALRKQTTHRTVRLEDVALPDISVRTTSECLDYIQQVVTRLKQFRSSARFRN
jgi:hypothetical protein